MAKSPAPKPEIDLSINAARAVMVAAQELDGAPVSELIPVLERTGFVRTLGGVDVYLAVRARIPELSRADLEGAVERREAHVMPAARGCMYLVAKSHAAAALQLAAQLSQRRDEREREKAGIELAELERVGAAVLEALAEGPLETNALRRKLPAGLVRSLGEIGKKLGISSTLPPALRQLEFQGRIDRIPETKKLDTERYLWHFREDVPETVTGPAEVHAAIAKVFFHAAGLATMRAFVEWSGLRQGDAATAIERLGLVAVAVAGSKETYFLAPERRELLGRPAGDAVAFLPFEDNLLACQGGPAFFVAPEHHGIPVPVWGDSKPSTLGEARHASLRTIIAGNQIAGFWEFDPDTHEVTTVCFDTVTKNNRERIAEQARTLGRFITEDLGHGRSHSLDTDAELRARAHYVRQLLG